jgi:hypothetical protein
MLSFLVADAANTINAKITIFIVMILCLSYFSINCLGSICYQKTQHGLETPLKNAQP